MAAELLPETRDRILEGALRAVGRVGFRHLTMSDVAESAALSRGTVYRYFPTKDELLAVLMEYEQDRFSGGLAKALESGGSDPSIEAVAEYIITYLREHPALTLLIDSEPAYVLAFLRRQLPVFHGISAELLAPVMAQAGPVQEGRVTAEELEDLLLRVVLSVFLVPGARSATEGVLEGALDSIVRLARPRV